MDAMSDISKGMVTLTCECMDTVEPYQTAYTRKFRLCVTVFDIL